VVECNRDAEHAGFASERIHAHEAWVWEKVDLQPGESKTMTPRIYPLYLSILDAATDRWTIVPGEYKVMAGPSPATLPLTTTVILEESAGR
jgi:hypothetical protein